MPERVKRAGSGRNLILAHGAPVGKKVRLPACKRLRWPGEPGRSMPSFSFYDVDDVLVGGGGAEDVEAQDAVAVSGGKGLRGDGDVRVAEAGEVLNDGDGGGATGAGVGQEGDAVGAV